MKSIADKITRKWDLWIYRRALRSLRRMIHTDPAMVYMMELKLRDLNTVTDMPPSLKLASETIIKSLMSSNENK